jgi:hypothetical protein
MHFFDIQDIISKIHTATWKLPRGTPTGPDNISIEGLLARPYTAVKLLAPLFYTIFTLKAIQMN